MGSCRCGVVRGSVPLSYAVSVPVLARLGVVSAVSGDWVWAGLTSSRVVVETRGGPIAEGCFVIQSLIAEAAALAACRGHNGVL